jgi:hypothetical protein
MNLNIPVVINWHEINHQYILKSKLQLSSVNKMYLIPIHSSWFTTEVYKSHLLRFYLCLCPFFSAHDCNHKEILNQLLRLKTACTIVYLLCVKLCNRRNFRIWFRKPKVFELVFESTQSITLILFRAELVYIMFIYSTV